MIEVLPDVFVVPANSKKGYGYSHFVKRDGGNVLLPRLKQALLSDSYVDLEEAGGVAWVLLSDRHFGGPGCRRSGVHFGAPLVASRIEASAMAGRCKIDRQLDYEPQTIDPSNILAIPTPGHTPGQMAYLIEVSGTRCLFAGDFAYRAGGKWQVGSKSRKAMERGISSLDGYSFDVYIGCADYGEAKSFVAANSIDDVADQILAACTKP